MAHQSVCGLVKSAPKSVANEVADFCIHELEKHGGMLQLLNFEIEPHVVSVLKVLVTLQRHYTFLLF